MVLRFFKYHRTFTVSRVVAHTHPHHMHTRKKRGIFASCVTGSIFCYFCECCFQVASFWDTAVNRDDGRRAAVAFPASMIQQSLRFPEHTHGYRPYFTELTRTQRRRQQRQRSAANYHARAIAAVTNFTSPDRSIPVVHLPLRLQRYHLSEPITLGFHISGE